MSDPFGGGTEPSQILVINDKGELHDRIILSNAPKHGAEVTDRDFVAKKGGVTTGSTKTAQVTLKAGETLTVKLVSNPTTGYMWHVLGPKYGPLELKKDDFEARRTDLAGAPGTQIFEFVAPKTAKNQGVLLVFNYGRSFEGLGTQSYELRVKVTE